MGGITWRDTAPAWYADRVGPLTLDDELAASGRVVVKSAVSDSAVSFGWFDAASTRAQSAGERYTKRSRLCICIEGPSRIGHYFRPEYATAADEGLLRPDGPVIQPDGTPHRWTLRYDPKGAGGCGRITFSLDDRQQTFDLDARHRRQGARFDRFGILQSQPADGHYVELYLDDLTYTAGGR